MQQRFDALVKALVRHDGVTVGNGKRGFESGACARDGRPFAMVRNRPFRKLALVNPP